MYDPYQSLYIHLPFCKVRCGYCDFATEAVASDDPRIDDYIDDIILQIRRDSKEGKLGSIKTVYLGGGTPSHVGPARLSKLLYTLSTSLHLEPEVECTMEANPESLTEAMVKDLWALGVNRLSIGVQSFNDRVLQTLGRPHDAEKAKQAVIMAKERFENVSVDMMCGIPGQSQDDFGYALVDAIKLGVTHVSVYPLMIEENTPFERLVDKGELIEATDDEQAAMMQIAHGTLEAAGLKRYEVASYAREGFECRHNISYWTGRPYLGYGTSAVTMTQNDSCRMRMQDGRVIEELDRKQMCAEDLMLGMRMCRGISEEQIRETMILLPDTLSVFRDLVSIGLVEHRDGRYRPTINGWLCGNELYGKLFDLAP